MKKLLTAMLLVCVCGIAAMAQNPVKWRTTYKMTSATEGVVTIKAVIEQGWHLYSTSLPEGGPRATVFDFSESKGIALVGKLTPSARPVEKADEMFGMTLSWWDKPVSFTQKFKVTDKAAATFTAKITYMTCNDASCMPPRTDTVTFKVAKPAGK